MEVALVQRRTLRLLFIAQVISGIGIAIGGSVGALLAADIAGIGVSGLAISTNVVGAALFAVRLDIAPVGSDVVARPGSERSELDAVRLVRLLDAGRP